MKKENLKDVANVSKGVLQEFKTFISKGNVLDMAVGVIIGGAFGKIVSSLVNNILMPLIGLILGGHDFTNLTIKFKDATIYYGIFLQSIIDFLIVAVCIFFLVKAMNKLSHKKETKAEAPKKNEEIILLEEIRDALVNKNK